MCGVSLRLFILFSLFALLSLGVMDIKGIIKSVGEEGLTKLTLQICEEGLRLTEEASHRLNRPIRFGHQINFLVMLNFSRSERYIDVVGLRKG